MGEKWVEMGKVGRKVYWEEEKWGKKCIEKGNEKKWKNMPKKESGKEWKSGREYMVMGLFG